MDTNTDNYEFELEFAYLKQIECVTKCIILMRNTMKLNMYDVEILATRLRNEHKKPFVEWRILPKHIFFQYLQEIGKDFP